LIDQLLIKGEEIKFFLKLVSIRLLTKKAEPSKLQEISLSYLWCSKYAKER